MSTKKDSPTLVSVIAMVAITSICIEQSLVSVPFSAGSDLPTAGVYVAPSVAASNLKSVLEDFEQTSATIRELGDKDDYWPIPIEVLERPRLEGIQLTAMVPSPLGGYYKGVLLLPEEIAGQEPGAKMNDLLREYRNHLRIQRSMPHADLGTLLAREFSGSSDTKYAGGPGKGPGGDVGGYSFFELTCKRKTTLTPNNPKGCPKTTNLNYLPACAKTMQDSCPSTTNPIKCPSMGPLGCMTTTPYTPWGCPPTINSWCDGISASGWPSAFELDVAGVEVPPPNGTDCQDWPQGGAVLSGVTPIACVLGRDNGSPLEWTCYVAQLDSSGGPYSDDEYFVENIYAGSESSTADIVHATAITWIGDYWCTDSASLPFPIYQDVDYEIVGPDGAKWQAALDPPISPDNFGQWDMGEIGPGFPGDGFEYGRFKLKTTYTTNSFYMLDFLPGSTFDSYVRYEVGGRSDDVIVVGWIDQNAIPLPDPDDVAGEIKDAFPLSGPPPGGVAVCDCLTLMNHLRDGKYDNDPAWTLGPSTEDPNRIYLLNWMFKWAGVTAGPPPDFRDSEDADVDEAKVAAYFADKTQFKTAGRFQVKWEVGGNIKEWLERDAIAGETPNLCDLSGTTICGAVPSWITGTEIPAQEGPHHGKWEVSLDRFTEHLDVSPNLHAVISFNTISSIGSGSQIFWENVGARITHLGINKKYGFNLEPQIFPTFSVFPNGRGGVATIPQVLPFDHFYPAPYPFGTVPCNSSYLIPSIPMENAQNGGRCGDGESAADSSAHTPDFLK